MMPANTTKSLRHVSASKKMPGPKGLPWIGQLPAFLTSKFFPKQMLKWAEEYNGVYQMELAGRKYVVITDPTLMAPILGRGGPGLPKSDGYNMWNSVFSPHAADGVKSIGTALEADEKWRVVRRSYGPAMGASKMGEYYPIVARCAAVLGDYLAAPAPPAPPAPPAASTSPASHAAVRPSVEVNELLKSLALQMIGLCVFDHDWGALEDPRDVPVAHALEGAMKEAGARARDPARVLAPWLFAEQRRAGQQAMDAFHAAAESLWRHIQSRGPPAEEDHSIAAQFARLADPARGPAALSEAEVCAEIAFLITAGLETTANTLTWLLFALHAHPEEAPRLEEELRRAGLMPVDGGRGGRGGNDAAVGEPDPTLAAFLTLPGGYDTIASLPYLDSFVREGMRLYCMAPNGALRQVPSGGPPARIGPYDIEPGTQVWAPFWGLMLSERNWERPLEFIPDRWASLDKRTGMPTASASSGDVAVSTASRCPFSTAMGALASASAAVGLPTSASADASADADAARRASRFMPFSEGSRNCVGQPLAMLMVKVVLSYLVSRFRVRLDEHRMGGVAGALDRQRVNLSLEVEGGMWLVLEPRGR